MHGHLLSRVCDYQVLTFPSDPDDLSSCSEADDEKEDGDEEGGEISPYYCRHCFTSSSKDWHHVGKERLLVCSDCRIYYKRYAAYPPLDGEVKERELERMKKELELVKKKEEENEAIVDDVKGELNLSAIEKDSIANGPEVEAKPNLAEPIEMKQELPKNVRNLFSPVAAVPQGGPAQMLSPTGQAKGTPDIQVLEHHRGPQQLPPQGGPMAPREPSPPPKHDGAECHRSQSAIFTRVWNRGEGNSCSRTDMIFKPVPDSKLARKRDERLRKASEREEALKVEQTKRAQQEALAQMPGAGLFPPGSDPFRVGTPHRPSPFPSGHPLGDNRPPSHMYPPGFAPAPPPALPTIMDVERRRLEELTAARVSAERQYAERMSVLATDPLVRLQMAGVNPEIPGHFGAPGALGLRGPSMRPHGPPPGLDPRFRSDLFLRPGYFSNFSSPEFLQRQFMMEREQATLLAAQSAAAQHTLLAQQEEFFRMEQEARARQVAANQGHHRP